MRLTTYTPADFAALREAAVRMGPEVSLNHRPFVDWYYTTNEACHLHLVREGDDRVVGTIGVEVMPFEANAQPVTMGFASNFHALQHGVGGILFMKWMKSSPLGAVFGGSPDTHRIIQGQKWTYFSGVDIYQLNRPYAAQAGEAAWRRTAKWALRTVQPKVRLDARRIPVSVREESDYSPDLLPHSSPFALRFNPTVEYLRWRYDTRLSFVRYRLFRIEDVGYVILNETPGRVIVAQCDGNDAEALAHGVTRAVAEVCTTPREVLLASSHPVMQRVFTGYGFRRTAERPFALGSLRKPIDITHDTSTWLVSFDWTDNGLRVPFLDQ